MFFSLFLLSVAVNQLDASPVPPETDVNNYLASFGYLHPKYKNSSNSVIAGETIRNAVRDFQSFFGLNITGVADEETLRWMGKPRCGVPDRIITDDSSTQQKRNINSNGENRWTKNELTYGIRKYTPDLDKSVVDEEIAKAFRLWEEVTPFTFTFIDMGKVDIEIRFENDSHSDDKNHYQFHKFDGPLGVLAHAAFPESGETHFDEAETWTINEGSNLFQVAVHEFGHVLGLSHSDTKADVMTPTYDYRPDFKLETGDISRIQELYGWNLKESLEEGESQEGLPLQFKELLADMKTTFDMELNLIKKDLEATKTSLANTRIRLSNMKYTVDDLTTKLNAQTNELVDIGQMPTSCEDLQQIGHKLNGFFMVKSVRKMEMIYCNFLANQNDKQKWIGFADVKSTPVYFYVQRNSSFNTTKTPIPFDLALVNEGNAMNLTSGKFTAPRPGIYFFSFAGTVRLSTSSSYVDFYSRLYLNGNVIGSSNVYEYNGPVDQYNPVTLQSTLNLKKGDQLWVQIDYSFRIIGSSSHLFDSVNHYTHFTGFMLEEEIVASL
ncbi:uncharacterized protein LOC124336166 isoform X2 [Daphnia pulicaria]|uniref:uncharacterized protein LOC124336166 isoform X2 n=1 Tax=Daphnia pulicaria TaxID=35523 RepID=UPI001EEBDD95|nr:uncharacterized protein LOC124336166 isoform X2 [Daphnia pulicaria]